ncbi:alpha/beta fold hydrolase [Sphingomicrobium aestuariivivum]|uniref:alpha/beta fold hydrolase n=1 Tax=Sphingomicrobium aestuariivivum TaxID=1582356 RepID=UPI001FD67543|nr:alpha/beta hydrolase [Sphingomicrobium aestuariivivum]MCJ8191978.1 alpha/beta hydrolase [Sphingomicrobium aestuariivivum]
MIAGSGGWSSKWAPFHDDLATVTQACSIDRPGWGMAGVGRGLTSPDKVEDYRETLALAGLQGPFVLVGHSLGGEEAVFWADRYPDEVAGLVLVDPGMPDFAIRMSTRAPLAFAEMREALMGAANYFLDCADRIEAMQAGGETEGLKRCSPRAENPEVAEVLATVAMDPERFRFNANEIMFMVDESVKPESYSGDLGELPMLLLQETLRKSPPGMSEEARAQSPLVDALLEEHHDRLIGYSSRAELRPVENASHDILADRPDAIVGALSEIVSIARADPSE